MIMQWIDLLLRCIKIGILATIYASVLIIVLILLSRISAFGAIKKVLKHRFKLFLALHLVISISLFKYSFSYWQDTGLGEAPSLPIGYGQRIYSPDFAWTDFYPDLNKTELNKDELHIEDFVVSNKKLCARVSHDNSNSLKFDFIVCDLPSNTHITFASAKDYKQFAVLNSLPMPEEFTDFKSHLQGYHAKKPTWKKWLLP
jgi:hypothetical protein